MLQVCIHDRQQLRIAFRPAPQHSARESALARPHHQANAGIFQGQLRDNRVDPVAAVIVHYNHFVGNTRRIQRGPHPPHQGSDISRFAEGGDDQS
jgi:hypothetical protein